jgi:hypothetical protein
MRIPVTVVIDMTDEQVTVYADKHGLPRDGGRLYAREVVADVQGYVLACVQDSAAFGETGAGEDARGADVTIKRGRG